MKEQSIISRIAALKAATTKELQVEWKKLYGDTPPPSCSKHMKQRLAYRIQEIAHGGLTKEMQQRLKQHMENRGKKKHADGTRLSAGTVLVREWRAVEHRVTVLNDGFDYMGKRYKSLTAIAVAITGTNWNGPAFFGLRSKRAAA